MAAPETERRPGPSGGLGLREHSSRELGRLAVLHVLVEMAAVEVLDLTGRSCEVGLDLPADVHDVTAARMETTAGRKAPLKQRRRLSRNLDEPFDVLVEPRQRAQE